jgi:hypothetical protein
MGLLWLILGWSFKWWMGVHKQDREFRWQLSELVVCEWWNWRAIQYRANRMLNTTGGSEPAEDSPHRLLCSGESHWSSEGADAEGWGHWSVSWKNEVIWFGYSQDYSCGQRALRRKWKQGPHLRNYTGSQGQRGWMELCLTLPRSWAPQSEGRFSLCLGWCWQDVRTVAERDGEVRKLTSGPEVAGQCCSTQDGTHRRPQ